MSKYNRQDILQAGVKLLMREGYAGLGVQRVLKECGIPKGSFYHFFESKEAFVIETLDFYITNLTGELKRIDETPGLSPLEKYYESFTVTVEILRTGEYQLTCPLLTILTDNIEDGTIREVLKEKFQEQEALGVKWIREGQEAGEIQTEMDPEELNKFLVNGFYGAMIRSKHEESMAPFMRFRESLAPYLLEARG